LNIFTIIQILTGTFLILTVLLSGYRIVVGPNLADRIIGFEVLTFVGVAAIAQFAVSTGQSVYMMVLICWALVSFLGTLGFARYLDKRGSDS
jgi:multicomponent Na+:H+ antiporter subunit F